VSIAAPNGFLKEEKKKKVELGSDDEEEGYINLSQYQPGQKKRREYYSSSRYNHWRYRDDDSSG